MKTFMVLSALLVATAAQTENDDSQTSTTDPTSENPPRPDCKCSLPSPPGSGGAPIPVAPSFNSMQQQPYYPPPNQPPQYMNYPYQQYPYQQFPYQQNPYQQFPYPPRPIPYMTPNSPSRSPVRRAVPYSYQWKPVQRSKNSRGPMASQGVPVQPYSRGTNYQSNYQNTQGSQQSELLYGGEPEGYWYEPDPSPVQQYPVQQVYYEVPKEDEYSYGSNPVQQMPVQQVLVMHR